MEVQEICSMDQLRTLQPEWNDLLVRSGRPSVYLTFEWVATWWECFQDRDRELYVLTVREAGALLAIAPFMKARRRFLGIPYLKIEFISAREYGFSHLAIAGFLEIILTERRSEVVAAILAHLAARQKEWTFLRFEPMAEDSPTFSLVMAAIEGRRLKVRRGDSAVSHEVHVDADWQEYFAGRAGRFRKNLRRDERLLCRHGDVSYLHVDSLGQLEHGFDDVIDIERRSWKWNRGLSINCMGYRGFFHAFAQEASRNGWLRLSILRVNGVNIAYCYGVAFEGTEVCFKASYDEAYKQYSPGSLLQWRRFEHGVAKGATVFDMMAGAPEYKKNWTTHERNLREIFVFNDTIRSNALYFLFFTLHLYGKFRFVPDLSKRVLRRLGFTLKNSELTRMDQLAAGTGPTPVER